MQLLRKIAILLAENDIQLQANSFYTNKNSLADMLLRV